MEKECTKCHVVKDISQFGNLARSKDGKSQSCRKCRGEDKQRWIQTPKGSAWRKKYQRNRHRISKQLLLKELGITSCSSCIESHPACLDFHHLDSKEFEISHATRLGHKHDAILAEAKKCVVLCSNCHRKAHWQD